jgi:hypothetical protein
MDKLGKVVSSVKKFDLSQIANDKVIVCLAFIGMAATIKTMWNPMSSYIFSKKQSEEEKAQHRASQLLFKYGGEWALIADGTEVTGQQIAMQLAREGFNIMIISKRLSDAEDLEEAIKRKYITVKTKTIEFDISKLFLTENINEFEKVFESIEEEISVIVNNLGLSPFEP